MCQPKHSHILVGPLPPPLGGTTVLFQQLIGELSERDDIVIHVINTVAKSGGIGGKLISLFRTTFSLLEAISKYDSVSFHGSVNGVTLFVPLLSLITRFYRKPLLVRVFGGDLDVVYDSMSAIGRAIFRVSILRSSAVLFETKHSVSKFSALSSAPIYWYPNSRPIFQVCHSSRTKVTSIVFLGHIKPEKGVLDLVEASQGLNVHVDFYGPLVSNITPDRLSTSNTTYQGVLPPSEIMNTLKNYDLLVLPTFYQGEGYPGVIVEAYMAGIPVISTNWRCIPEIVDSNSGLLVEPRNPTALRQAIQSLILDEALYQQLVMGAKEKCGSFSSVYWADFYRELVLKLRHV